MRQQNIEYIVTKFQQAYPNVSMEKLRTRLSSASTDDICRLADIIERVGIETIKAVLNK